MAIVRVTLAEDHEVAQPCLRTALTDTDIDVRAEAATVEVALDDVVANQPDVALVDVRLTGGAFALAAAIGRTVPRTAVIMLAPPRADDRPGHDALLEALRVGASGYLPRDIAPRSLANALHGVLSNGEIAIPRSVVARVVDELRGNGSRRLIVGERTVQLTGREWEILTRLERNFTTQQISEELYISPVTVRRHVSTVLRKLRVQHRDQAVRLFRSSQRRSAGRSLAARAPDR